ncbi:phage tail tip fiber protein [Buttiauxella noackiae]|uniref:phage tail tip fiber protein n=1 Tax=Buttiauxella noackiae TaxID=82992 RepID=UPI00068EA916|nr:DUF1983 domain-containing protein [Buttiauxella noackiae]
MPIVVPMAIIAAASMAAALYAAGVALTIAVVAGVAVAAAMCLMALSMETGVPRFNSPDSGSALGTVTDPKTVLPVVYGNTRVGGIIAKKDIYAQDTTYLVQVFAVSEGPIECFTQIYFDNKKLLIDGNEHRDGVIPKSRIRGNYGDIIQIEVSTGKNPGHHLGLAHQYLGKGWDTTATGNGVASVCVVMRKTNKALTDGIDILQPSSQFACDLKGRLITDLTTGQVTASSNGPSQVLDYLTNTKYGMGVPVERIDVDSFKAAATRTISYFSDGSVDPNGTFKKNLTDLCASFGGVVFDQFGVVTMALDAPDVVKYTFDETNISAGNITLKSGESAEYYNTLNISYNDPDMDYASNVLRYPSDITNDPVIVKDKRVIAKDLTYRFVKSTSQLDKLGSVERNKCKLYKQMSFVTMDAYTLSVWDVIKISFNELKLKDTLWRVISIVPSLDGGMAGTMSVQCVEYNSAVYTDMDFAAKPDYTPSLISGDLATPTNLQAQGTGETVYGRNVLLTWDCAEDFNRYRFFVQYKEAGATDWIDIGATSQLMYQIHGLKNGVNYDFRVCSTGLVYRSAWVELLNQTTAIVYALPAPVVRLRNTSGIVNGKFETKHEDFHIEWDDQSTLDVTINGQVSKFVDLLQHYEIRINTKNRDYFYETTNLHWIYTLSQNLQNGAARDLTVGVTAIGYGGRKSTETLIQVFNAQCGAITGFTANAGFDTIFCTWVKPTDEDLAGVVVQIATDAQFTQNVITHQDTSLGSVMNIAIPNGKYYVKAAAFDVFGTDSLTYTAAVYVDIQSQVNWTNQDEQALKDFLDLEQALDSTIEAAFERSKDALQIEISNLHTNVTNETDTKIAGTVTNLKQIVQDGDKLITEQLNQVKTTIEKDIQAAITRLDTTNANQDTANAQAIQTVKSEMRDNIAQVTINSQTQVDNLKNAINAHHEIKVNANGVIAGMGLYADDVTKSSAIYFVADELKFITAKTAGNVSNPTIPFAIQNNKVFLNTAVIANASIGSAMIANAAIGSAHIVTGSITEAHIQNASITNAKIAGAIQSNNYVAGSSGWKIDKSGSSEFSGVTVRGHIEAVSGSFSGNIYANTGVLNDVTINGNCRILGNLDANQINGLPSFRVAGADVNKTVSGGELVWIVPQSSPFVIPSTNGKMNMCGLINARMNVIEPSEGRPVRPAVYRTYKYTDSGWQLVAETSNGFALVEVGAYGGSIAAAVFVPYPEEDNQEGGSSLLRGYVRASNVRGAYALYN